MRDWKIPKKKEIYFKTCFTIRTCVFKFYNSEEFKIIQVWKLETYYKILFSFINKGVHLHQGL